MATAWVLRSPCGCPWAIVVRDMTATAAWREVAGRRAVAYAQAGWTLTAEPSGPAVAAFREAGTCTHVAGRLPNVPEPAIFASAHEFRVDPQDLRDLLNTAAEQPPAPAPGPGDPGDLPKILAWLRADDAEATR